MHAPMDPRSDIGTFFLSKYNENKVVYATPSLLDGRKQTVHRRTDIHSNKVTSKNRGELKGCFRLIEVILGHSLSPWTVIRVPAISILKGFETSAISSTEK